MHLHKTGLGVITCTFSQFTLYRKLSSSWLYVRHTEQLLSPNGLVQHFGLFNLILILSKGVLFLKCKTSNRVKMSLIVRKSQLEFFTREYFNKGSCDEGIKNNIAVPPTPGVERSLVLQGNIYIKVFEWMCSDYVYIVLIVYPYTPLVGRSFVLQGKDCWVQFIYIPRMYALNVAVKWSHDFNSDIFIHILYNLYIWGKRNAQQAEVLV